MNNVESFINNNVYRLNETLSSVTYNALMQMIDDAIVEYDISLSTSLSTLYERLKYNDDLKSTFLNIVNNDIDSLCEKYDSYDNDELNDFIDSIAFE